MTDTRTEHVRTEHIRTERRGALGVITLDRQEALNALTHDMVRAMADALRSWRSDDAVERVLITGAGERALCAGGDVVTLARDVAETGGVGGGAFWRDEYALNAMIARYPKPVIALQHGIVLGGGVGISGHASHRIATDSTRIGFPEVTIGFVPDVGATWLLTRVPAGAPGAELGTRAALSGEHFGPADAVLLGLSDVVVAQSRIAELVERLETEDADAAIAAVAVAPQAAVSTDGRLAGEQALIDAAFVGDDAAAIVARLEASGPEGAGVAATIAKRSPLAVAVTLEALRRARGLGSLEQALATEYRVSRNVSLLPDFAEGIRAQLIDKDRAPRWQPASLSQVTPAMVEACFAPAPEGDLRLPEGDLRLPEGGPLPQPTSSKETA
ncbi:3-hydroxyisobutyryl-CoA hydrolase [Agrococcus beijingensis]|uniref:3-hydroxyisobutyryl-CoA hydrolase n=1 Tax=Agrococcus beijingensis TaxID=3068634 RepID=UPI002741328F|nr:3-hydroxyisobutyryl-CoA hydrolase [Agrococcus sp. REN33]